MGPRLKPDGEIVTRTPPTFSWSDIDRRSFLKAAGAAAAAGPFAGCQALIQDDDTGVQNGGAQGRESIPDDPLTIAVVAFISGPAAIFGNPAVDAAKLLRDQINERGGILGEREIELEIVDENSDEVVQDYRRLVQDEEIDMIIGYISSANMLSVGPIAEDLEEFTIIFDAGSNALFEEGVTDPQWVFRTEAHLSVGAVGGAQMVANALPDVERVAGINQDYAWGRDNMDMFSAALNRLKPDVEIVSEQWPEIFESDFGPFISSLVDAEPDIVYTSHWGGDLVTLIGQARRQGLLDQTTFMFNAGPHAWSELGRDTPEDHFWAPRGPHLPGLVPGQIHRNFVESFEDRFGIPALSHGSYHMWQAIMFYVTAIEKAFELTGRYPDDEEIITAMENLGLPTPSGWVGLTNSGGHQAVESSVWGRSTLGDQWPELSDVVWIAPENANPPPDLTTAEWIQQLG